MEIKRMDGCKNKWTIQSKPKYIKSILSAVIHHTATFSEQSTIDWFTKSTQDKSNKSSSAHFLIGKSGEIWQFVGEDERAWHAGVSELIVNGIKYTNWNMFSIGIELVGDGNLRPYTGQQYDSLINLLSMEINRFNIKKEFLVGHEQIAPGRKTDPGKLFDWERLYRGVYDTITIGANSPANVIYSVGKDGD
jgi:N-acetylmuramoyl-L-alanine amidase